MSEILIKYIQKKSEEGDNEAKETLAKYYELLLKNFSSEVNNKSKPVNVVKTQQYNYKQEDDIHLDIRY